MAIYALGTPQIETALNEDPLYISIFIFQLKLCQASLSLSLYLSLSPVNSFTEDNMDNFPNKVLWLICNDFLIYFSKIFQNEGRAGLAKLFVTVK